MNLRRYNNARHVHRLYVGIDRNGKDMFVSAYTQKEARDEMRKKGFRPVKIRQT